MLCTGTWKLPYHDKNVLQHSIHCSAPEGCLQWFTGSSGTIESWNFNGGIHLANQNYFSCIRAEQVGNLGLNIENCTG